MNAAELAELYRRDLKRLHQEIEAFPEEQLWITVGGASNSAGNLALHLEGNLRDFIGREMGGVEYVRERDKEFSSKNVSKADLLQRIAALQELIPGVVAGLTAELLAQDSPRMVLGKPIRVGMFVMHLSGHFNYHLGQIDILRRVLTGESALPLAGL